MEAGKLFSGCRWKRTTVSQGQLLIHFRGVRKFNDDKLSSSAAARLCEAVVKVNENSRA